MTIEQRIKELLGEGKDEPTTPTKENEVVTDIQLDEEAAKAKAMSEIENLLKNKHPDATIKWEENNCRAYMGTQVVGSEQYVPKKFGTTTESVESQPDELKVDISEDVEALFNGEDTLSEEFKTKATTIFEAAVVTRVKEELAKLEEGFDKRVEETAGQLYEALVEKVDGYLDYAVEKWITDNEVALEAGIKTTIFESFFGQLKTLFEQHYIDVPEEKFDLVGSLESKVEELSNKLSESTDIIVEQRKEMIALKRTNIVKEISEGLALTEQEKLEKMSAELEYEDEDTFKSKVKDLKESYFNKKNPKPIVESVVTDAPVIEENKSTPQLDPVMSQYVNTIK